MEEAGTNQLARYGRKGYFEMSHEEGPSLFMAVDASEVALV
jgi:hypothetical protein